MESLRKREKVMLINSSGAGCDGGGFSLFFPFLPP
jgi:hypothetical protein